MGVTDVWTDYSLGKKYAVVYSRFASVPFECRRDDCGLELPFHLSVCFSLIFVYALYIDVAIAALEI